MPFLPTEIQSRQSFRKRSSTSADLLVAVIYDAFASNACAAIHVQSGIFAVERQSLEN